MYIYLYIYTSIYIFTCLFINIYIYGVCAFRWVCIFHEARMCEGIYEFDESGVQRHLPSLLESCHFSWWVLVHSLSHVTYEWHMCVFRWICVFYEASMCEGIYVFNIIHRHIGRQQTTGQINQKTWHLYTSAAITTVTRASVTNAGAHAHDDVACFEYIASPPPHTRTHTGTHTASTGERCSINLPLSAYALAPPCCQVYVWVHACIRECVWGNATGYGRVDAQVSRYCAFPFTPRKYKCPRVYIYIYMYIYMFIYVYTYIYLHTYTYTYI